MKRIILFLFVITQLMFIGCAASNNSEMLLEEQKRAYDVVVEYAMSCLSVEEKQEILKQVEGDIKKAEEGKIEIEISIGKLKIDKLFLKEKLEKNIANEKLAAANNKFSYKNKRDSIKNIYYGDYTSYNNEIKKLQSEISQAYGNYTRQAIAIRNMGNITEGYRNTLLESAENEYLKVQRSCEIRIEELGEKWRNKELYEQYNKAYNEEDLKLEKSILNLELNYQRDCNTVDIKISSLIRQR